MDYSEWDAYSTETNSDTPHQSSESALIGSSILKSGRNTIRGLVLIVLSLLLNTINTALTFDASIVSCFEALNLYLVNGSLPGAH